MEIRPSLLAAVSLVLLGTGCASLPPGVSATEYGQWRMTEYNRGHLRPADAYQAYQLERQARYAGNGCYGGEPAGSYCNRASPVDNGRDYGSHRPVENPTEIQTPERAR